MNIHKYICICKQKYICTYKYMCIHTYDIHLFIHIQIQSVADFDQNELLTKKLKEDLDRSRQENRLLMQELKKIEEAFDRSCGGSLEQVMILCFVSCIEFGINLYDLSTS